MITSLRSSLWLTVLASAPLLLLACSSSGTGGSGGSSGSSTSSSGASTSGTTGPSSSSSSASTSTSSSGASSSGSTSGTGGASSSSGSSTSSSTSSTGSSSGSFDATPQCNKNPVPPHGDLTSPIEPAPPAVANSLFVTDWAAVPASGGWQRTQIIDACRMHADGKTWHGKTAVRVEVDPGDDPLSLGAGSERAEALVVQDQNQQSVTNNTQSGDQYYATSWYFPATWDGTFLHGNDNSWSAVLQIYGWAAVQAGRRDTGLPQKYWFTTQSGNDPQLANDSINLGHWTDFVFEIHWASQTYTIWRRDEGEQKFANMATGTNATGDANGDYYIKQGLYRGGDVNGRVDVLWIGPTALATTFAGAENAAFGTSDGHN